MHVPAARTEDALLESGPARRSPVQRRSRARVQAILDATATLAIEGRVEDLTTRAIAQRAGVPVASLYQYFADRDEVLYALIESDMREMDEQVFADLAALESYSLSAVIETTMRAYVEVYRRRPAFVEIWMRGRANSAIRELGREHNRRTAAQLRELLASQELIVQDVPESVGELAVEVGDRAFQLAFEHEIAGDDFLIDEAIRLVTAYLAPYAAVV